MFFRNEYWDSENEFFFSAIEERVEATLLLGSLSSTFEGMPEGFGVVAAVQCHSMVRYMSFVPRHALVVAQPHERAYTGLHNAPCSLIPLSLRARFGGKRVGNWVGKSLPLEQS